MITLNRPTPTADVGGSPAIDSRGRPSAQLILDGVIAGYIHDISGRHPRPQLSSDATESSLATLAEFRQDRR